MCPFPCPKFGNVFVDEFSECCDIERPHGLCVRNKGMKEKRCFLKHKGLHGSLFCCSMCVNIILLKLYIFLKETYILIENMFIGIEGQESRKVYYWQLAVRNVCLSPCVSVQGFVRTSVVKPLPGFLSRCRQVLFEETCLCICFAGLISV